MAKVKKEKKSKESSTPPAPAVTQSLPVRFRPQRLKDLVGQDHIITQLKGMRKTGKWPAAFLIDGQTGGGKTTVARIIHLMLNCEKGTACGKCDSCKMGATHHPDLITVNAGVDGKVDDIRKLVKGARVSPMFNKRIILIDEAHKLTGASEEALLVPLEEPSANTIFILCTTEPESMKDTFKNRCHRFTMKPIEPAAIVERLAFIAKEEGHDIKSMKNGDEILHLIADFSNGSMREAISLLSNVLCSADGGADITTKEVLTASLQNSEVDLDKASVSLIAALLNNDIKAAIKFVRISGNIRGLLSKATWLVDHLIGVKTKTSKFIPYSGRLFSKIATEKKIKVKLSSLMRIQIILCDTTMKLNTTSINESILLQTAVFGYALNSEDNSDESEE